MHTNLEKHFKQWLDGDAGFLDGLSQAHYSFKRGKIDLNDILEVYTRQAYRAGVTLGINSVKATIDQHVDKFNISNECN